MYRKSFIFFILVIKFFVVSGEKNLLIVKEEGSSWISTENLATMIKVSLNTSVCANVYLIGDSQEFETLFNVFMRAYPYEYTLNKKTYMCSGYFIIATSSETIMEALKSVPTKISNIEILIVIDSKVQLSAQLFNVSIYENSNVNIVAKNGLWTLSENFLKPRIFKKVFRYDEMIHKRGIVNLKGRELQVATDFNRPLSYLNNTVFRTINGIEREVFVERDYKKDDSELDGVEIKLFLLISERLNFTWNIWSPNGPYRYGRKNDTGWHGGIIGLMVKEEVDIAFGGIWLELAQYEVTNLTRPWGQLGVHFLVPRPKRYTSFWALTRPLSPEVWFAVVLMIFFQSIYVCLRSRITPEVPRRFENFSVTCPELTARLLGLSFNLSWRTFEAQFQLWQMIGVLIVTAYSSSLAASLASSEYEDRIDTTQQFIEANLTWGREGNPPAFSSFNSPLDPWANKFLSRFQSETDETERHEKILKGNYAILGRVVGSVFYPENWIQDEDMKGYRVMKNHLGQFYTSFAVQPWLLEACDQVMLSLRETGLVDYHLRDVIRRRTAAAYHEVLIEYDDLAAGPRVLNLTPLGAAFAMLVVGLLLATCFFIFEHRFGKKLKNN